MIEEERHYYLAWQLLLPGQSRRFRDLLAVFKSAQAAFAAPLRELVPVLGKTLSQEVGKRRDTLDITRELTKLKQAGVELIHWGPKI